MASRWRTADIPLAVLVAGLVLFAGGVLLLASTGAAGVAVAAVAVAAAVGLAVVWSEVPFDLPRSGRDGPGDSADSG